MDVSSLPVTNLLIVGDDLRVLHAVRRSFPSPRYHCVPATSGGIALDLMRQLPFRLVLCELRLPDRDGLQFLRCGLSLNPEAAFLMISDHKDWGLAIEAMKIGASDCLPKPLQRDRLVGSVHRALDRRRQKTEQDTLETLLRQTLQERTDHLQTALKQVEENQRCTLETLVLALDAREHETQLHSLRVQAFTLMLAEKCGYSRALLRGLGQGALLHDIGKIAVPDAILLKSGKLTPEEFQVMKQHTIHGYRILSRIPYLGQPAMIALCHHERIDGTGYPSRLAGDAIPLAARIFAVADTLDAITAGRRYSPPRTLEEARKEIRRCAGTQFDPDVADVFLSSSDDEWLTLREEVGSRHDTAGPPHSTTLALQAAPL